MSKISLQMYTMRDYMKTAQDIESTFEKLSNIGYRNIQPILPDFMNAVTFKALMDRYDLKPDSFSYTAPDMINNIDSICSTSDTLGVNMVRTAGMPYEQADTKEGFKRYAEEINKKARVLHAHSLIYIYHFHAYEYANFDDCTGMDILLKETDPECVHFQPDVHWMAAAGVEPSTGLYAFRDRMEYIHMQDYAIIRDPGIREPVARKIVPVGQGNLNWSGIIKAGNDLGVSMFVVEMDYCLGETFACVKASYDNLRKLGLE